MENYFVVLELPKTEVISNSQGAKDNFWSNTRNLLQKGNAIIVSSRKDTGVCEELKSYLSGVNDFTTFVLLQTMLKPADLINKTILFPKLASSINVDAPVEIIDYDSRFQVLVQA